MRFLEEKKANVSSVTNSEMNESFLNLDIDFNGVSEINEVGIRNNLPALDLFLNLSQKGYYFWIEPKNNRKGQAYFWITATKQGEDREVFSLKVNNEILKAVITVLRREVTDISNIDANELEQFNKEVSNFEYVLFVNERAQGRMMRKTYTTNGQMYSSPYKRGMIVYKPYLNPELKAYLNA